MTIEEMKRRKKELGYTYEKIAELSGVPLGTVQKFFAGVTKTPRYETLQALKKVFQTEDYYNKLYLAQKMEQQERVGESPTAYNVRRQGEYTLEDYYSLPDERRVELIDGVIYDMASPSSVHQWFCIRLGANLLNYIQNQKGTCMPLISPIDVQLDQDDRTMVQPDVIVVCNRDIIKNRCVYGAPDLVIEVLSKSTRKKDMFTKLVKYKEAGVREYWIIDPDSRKVIVYDLEHDGIPVIYGFDAKVPVGIFDSKCEIDFSEIFEEIHFLYE